MELSTLNPQDLKWALRRCPKKVLELLRAYPRKACVAGGFIRSCVANEPINDVDIFAPDKETAKKMADFLAAGDKPEDAPKRIFTSDNAFTVKGYFITPQIVHRWTFPDVLDVVPSFDFTIACACFWWDPKLNKWSSACDPNFYSDLAAKRLVYRSPERNEDAGGSMLRVLKFYQRGYRIPLDSLGRVISRLMQGVEKGSNLFHDEKKLAHVLGGLLREVDPDIDPNHIAHLPSESEPEEVNLE